MNESNNTYQNISINNEYKSEMNPKLLNEKKLLPDIYSKKNIRKKIYMEAYQNIDNLYNKKNNVFHNKNLKKKNFTNEVELKSKSNYLKNRKKSLFLYNFNELNNIYVFEKKKLKLKRLKKILNKENINNKTNKDDENENNNIYFTNINHEKDIEEQNKNNEEISSKYNESEITINEIKNLDENENIKIKPKKVEINTNRLNNDNIKQLEMINKMQRFQTPMHNNFGFKPSFKIKKNFQVLKFETYFKDYKKENLKYNPIFNVYNN